MQRRALWFGSLFSAASTLAAGCNDLGTCDDPLSGRTPVKVAGPEIMYAGQAIMNASCAGGTCHSSNAKGASRQGAPEGLDFDLALAPAGAVIPGPDGGVVAVQLNNVDVAGLRNRQRKIFDERELVWEQIDKGLMPPADDFKSKVTSIARFMFGSDGSCPAGTNLESFTDAKKELRNWLACGTPIVETNSASLPFVPVSPSSDAGAPEKAAGAIAYAGAVGYQFPACGATGGEAGAAPTFEQIYTNVLMKGSNLCVGCHTGSSFMGNFDMSTIDIAYTELLGMSGMGGTTDCATNPRPMVKPSDAAGSYLIAKFGGTDAGAACGSPMPLGSTGLNAADLQLVRDWIAGGAVRR
jgi:hypothetical protein